MSDALIIENLQLRALAHSLNRELGESNSKVAELQSKLDEAFKAWEEVDSFVRPQTKLGYMVSGRALELLKEGEANRAKLDEIEKQEPIAFIKYCDIRKKDLVITKWDLNKGDPFVTAAWDGAIPLFESVKKS